MARFAGISNLQAFHGWIRRTFRKDVPAQGQLLLKRLAFEAFKRIIFKTPVDTGRLRGNWQASVGQPKTRELQRKDKPGQATLASGLAALSDVPPGVVVWITNNLPYAERIESGYGAENVPGQMVGRTLEELSHLDFSGAGGGQ